MLLVLKENFVQWRQLIGLWRVSACLSVPSGGKFVSDDGNLCYWFGLYPEQLTVTLRVVGMKELYPCVSEAESAPFIMCVLCGSYCLKQG